MASLRFNYNGDKRPERGRAPMNPYMTRSLGYPIYGYHPMPYPAPERHDAPYIRPDVEEKETPADDSYKPAVKERLQEQEVITPDDVCLNRDESQNNSKEDGPAAEKKPAKEEIQAVIPEQPEGSAKTASEKLLGKLEVFETGLTSTREQLNLAKVFFDEIIYKMESFQQIMDILKANEERKTAGVSAQTVYNKTTHDSIDDFLELLQTPALQNILRQLLLGILR